MEYMGNTIRHEELENTIGHGELARQATVEKLTWQANKIATNSTDDEEQPSDRGACRLAVKPVDQHS